jgi:hypothetical protein
METTMNNASKLSGLIALGAALAMPVAFAQDATPTDPAAQAAPTAAPAPAAEPKQVTWADLDTDKNGSLSKAEVATVPELAQSFDAADANADGQLTAEEYKAHAAKASGAATDGSSTP